MEHLTAEDPNLTWNLTWLRCLLAKA